MPRSGALAWERAAFAEVFKVQLAAANREVARLNAMVAEVARLKAVAA